MATIALPRLVPSPPPNSPSSAITSPITPPRSLHGLSASSSTTASCPVPIPVPNKHIPKCPTGPAKVGDSETPPCSPDQTELTEPTEPPEPPEPAQATAPAQQSSLLFPPNAFFRLESAGSSIYEIDAAQIAEAIDYAARQPLPEPSAVFPWLHGIHRYNRLQQNFFSGRDCTAKSTPACLRGITIVKADGKLSTACLKGAVSPCELMYTDIGRDFIESDPVEGFSIRNFHIQPIKAALTSDIVVYGESHREARKVALEFATAQRRWREKQARQGRALPEYNTFVCTSPFVDFEEKYSHLVAVDSAGVATGKVLDFMFEERREMWEMTKATEISQNVFLGPTPEPGSEEEHLYDVLMECSDAGRLNPSLLQFVAENPSDAPRPSAHDFPSSGSIVPSSWSQAEANGFLETCKWMFHISHGTLPAVYATDSDIEEDTNMFETLELPRPRKILIHCTDGYTESSLLALAYLSFSTARPLPQAWTYLHTAKKRNFFAYPSDVSFLSSIAPRLLSETPLAVDPSLRDNIERLTIDDPDWFSSFDGSLPSRILDYLYLGNLTHANNPDLLRELNICQILSVGERASWKDEELEKWGSTNICVVKGVQDNGIDPLTAEFLRCIDFIEQGRRKGTATLVHCRVGVSRSATICIAEVMRAMDLSFPRAYCFVRARRLNVIIQPHLRFAYELLRWEEHLQSKGEAHLPFKREMEWGEIAREIALMNRPYAK